MPLTLAQAVDELADHAPVADLVRRLNLAEERLIAMGKWRGLMVRVAFSAENGLFSLPQSLETCIAATVDGSPALIRGPWYEFLPGGWGSPDEASSYPVPIDRGLHAAFRDVSWAGGPPPEGLRFEFEEADDLTGITIAYEGEGPASEATYGLPTRYKGSFVSDGDPVEIPTNDFAFTRIGSLKKDRTKGRVFVRGADSGTLLSVMEPRDTVMRLRRYEVPSLGRLSAPDELSPNPKQRVVGYCKKAFRRLADPTDELVIESVYALRCALSALQYEDEASEERATTHWGLARAALDDALSEHRGSSSRQVPIYNRGTMGSRLRAIR
jgi:hypothetical protein